MQLSVSDDTDSTKAVMFSLLSLSSLHRNGNSTEVGRLKYRALRALRNALQVDAIQPQEAQQHVAASLLLCRGEVRYISSEQVATTSATQVGLTTFTDITII
jgi:hypothetical protein